MTLRASPGLLVFYFFEWFILQIVQLFSKPAIRPEEDVQGKVVVITGAGAGLGKQTTCEMAKRGATVVMGCRNMTEGEKVRKEIRDKTGSEKLDLLELDLADLSSIRRFASEVQKKYPEIHILVNNAGISLDSKELQKTKDGFELHMGTNHLGHFLLTNLLLPNIQKAPSGGRVVTVASTTLVMTNFDLDDMMMENATSLGIGNTMPYNNSKFANALFSKELGKRYMGTGVRSYCVCPGLAKTSVFRHYSAIGQILVGLALNTIGLPTEKAADIILYCALSKEVAQKSGEMYRFNKRCSNIEKLFDEDLAFSLWNKSEELVGLKQR